MQLFEITEPNVKNFMQHLFKLDTFNKFELRSASINSFAFFEIAKRAEPLGWAAISPYILGLIKGSAKPDSMKIVLAHPDPGSLHQNAAAFFLNIQYEAGRVNCTTATAQKEFAMDKSLDIIWDKWAADFFAEHNFTTRED